MNYKVLSHDYTNTGGGCMVSTFQVWLEDENKTVFLHMNEEGGTLATCDYINNDIEYDETMMLDNFSQETLEVTHKYFELYKYCQFEYFKKDCKRYGYKANLRFEMLPDEMQQQITANYRKWHEDEIGDTYETNGYELFLDTSYVEPDPEIIEAKAMLQYMEDVMDQLHTPMDSELNEKFYNLDASVTFGDKTFAIKNCAAIYNAIQSCLKEFIDEY